MLHVQTQTLSIQIMTAEFQFEKFIKRSQEGKINVSGILSKECFLQWLKQNEPLPINAAEAFQKALIARCKETIY